MVIKAKAMISLFLGSRTVPKDLIPGIIKYYRVYALFAVDTDLWRIDVTIAGVQLNRER